ncbi:hypothetical protein RC083_09415 [Pseudoalteromonas haloplanktis]|uniref:Orphan protein n=1 Tax=Pseudoalteromonas haloplanktis TaxID=228 RepID=A0ABU1BBQ3_PSEHA|nr:hypothetical protein [Pseudoalteromonas haloplanktis]MDQ9091810.1 hypothetical protein [Pseudoalteromonas haloplanktis]
MSLPIPTSIAAPMAIPLGPKTPIKAIPAAAPFPSYVSLSGSDITAFLLALFEQPQSNAITTKNKNVFL